MEELKVMLKMLNVKFVYQDDVIIIRDLTNDFKKFIINILDINKIDYTEFININVLFIKF